MIGLRGLLAGALLLGPLACAAEPPTGEKGDTVAAPAVRAVSTTGEADAYTFAVTLESPDIGCARYASWWEVVDADEKLVYRRILGHSHADEQPFTRAGGPVAVAADATVTVRLHMHPGGYAPAAMVGSVAAGFTATTLAEGSAAGLASAAPQPSGCAF